MAFLEKIANIISYLPFVASCYSGIATIFMLHRVDKLDKNKLFPNENMKVSPEFLENFIRGLMENGYDFISLDELYDILKSGKKVKKKIIFTLDDGYKDNFYNAYNIFKKYKIPFTIYVTVAFPERKAVLWWYIIEEIILKNDKIILSDGKVFYCRTPNEKVDTFMNLRNIIMYELEQKNLLNELRNLFKNYNINWFEKNEELCMSWDEIINLSKDPIVTIGNHTVNHLVFSKLSENEILKEIIEANEMLEDKLGKKIEHFAYPFGDRKSVTKREMDIVKRLNFKTVVTTRFGNIFHKHADFCNCCLPRIMLTENFKIKDIGKIRRRRIVYW